MAQGGRGWFHRKRHQPEPAPTQPSEHLAFDQLHPSDRLFDPSEVEHAEWSPEDRERTAPVPPAEAVAPARGQAEPSDNTPRSSALGSPGPALEQEAGGEAPPDRSPRGDLSADPTSVQTVPEGHPTAVAIDWDAATAAALSDEPEPDAPATQRPPLPASTADRLLEDIIREIVGDAAVDTASALQPARPAPSAAANGAGAGPSLAPAATASTSREPTSDESAADSDSREIEPGDSSGVSINATSHLASSSATTPAVTGIEDEEFPRGSDAASGEARALHTEVHRSGIVDPSSPDPARPRSATARDLSDESSVDAIGTEHSSPGLMAPTFATQPVDASDSVRIQPEPARTRSFPPVSRETMEGRTDAPVSRETGTEYGGTPLADQLADETRRRIALEAAVLPLPASTRVLTISNQKGGVGKTTTAVNLAAALARSGAHVLVIDLDPQGNASTALGVDHRSEQQSVYDVLVSDLSLAEVIRSSTEHEMLDCVPATIHLAGAEIELVSLVAREQRLRRALDRHLDGMARPYDYVLIDCPPSLGLLTINAFVAAREVLIPIQCEYYALEGLSQLLSNIELIEKHLNPELRLSTILLTMYDSRTNLAQQVAQEVREHFPAQTLDTIIPRSVRVSEAPSYGQSVISYDYGSSGSLSYREAAAEIAWRGTTDERESN